MMALSCALFTEPLYASEPSETFSLNYVRADVKHSGIKNSLNGSNIKYRHEFNERTGITASLTVAKNEDNQNGWYRGYGFDETTGKWSQNKLMYGKVITTTQRHYSVSAGPSFRFNDYLSVYALAGIGQITSTVSTRSGKSSDRHTAVSYGAGIQINPVSNWVIDVAYEGTGSDDWRTSAFIVGVGYRF